jgi:hypothetical protein
VSVIDVDDDERGGRRGRHLRQVLHSDVSLRRGHRDLTRHVRPELRLASRLPPPPRRDVEGRQGRGGEGSEEEGGGHGEVRNSRCGRGLEET